MRFQRLAYRTQLQRHRLSGGALVGSGRGRPRKVEQKKPLYQDDEGGADESDESDEEELPSPKEEERPRPVKRTQSMMSQVQVRRGPGKREITKMKIDHAAKIAQEVEASIKNPYPENLKTALTKISPDAFTLYRALVELVPETSFRAIAEPREQAMTYVSGGEKEDHWKAIWEDRSRNADASKDWLAEYFPRPKTKKPKWKIAGKEVRSGTMAVAHVVEAAIPRVPASVLVPFVGRAFAYYIHARYLSSKDSGNHASEIQKIREWRAAARKRPDREETYNFFQTMTQLGEHSTVVRNTVSQQAQQKKTSKQNVMPYAIFHKARELSFQSDDVWHNFAFVILSTGTRPSDAMFLSNFSVPDSTDMQEMTENASIAPFFAPELIAISGLGKKREAFDSSVRYAPFIRDDPTTLGPKPALRREELQGYVENLRREAKLPLLDRRQYAEDESYLSQLTSKHLPKIQGVFRILFDEKKLGFKVTPKDGRALYAVNAFDRVSQRSDFRMNMNTYMGQVLGHEPGGKIAPNYQGFKFDYGHSEHPPSLVSKVTEIGTQVNEISDRVDDLEGVTDELAKPPPAKRPRNPGRTETDADNAIQQMFDRDEKITVRAVKNKGFGTHAAMVAVKRWRAAH